MSVPAMIAGTVAVDLQKRLAVGLARRQPGELEQRRHEIDGAHLRLDDAGLEPPGAERISGTSTISSKSAAPCMW